MNLTRMTWLVRWSTHWAAVAGTAAALVAGCSEPASPDDAPGGRDAGPGADGALPDAETTLPCHDDLASIAPGETALIACEHDLGGARVTLAEDVTLVLAGGRIHDGTLVFDEGQIDGGLLELSLDIEGTAQLLESVFVFEKSRWGITEGEVSDPVAIANTDRINRAISLTKRLGATVFHVDGIDAFFSVSHTEPRHDPEASIFIPSDLHFRMGLDCNLRVQPNDQEGYVLVHSRGTENVRISGGVLWGDRYAHDYTTVDSTHDWGHVMDLRGVHDAVVDGIEMREGSGDGLHIAGVGHRNRDGSLKPDGRESRNVVVRNCTIDDNRRNNISITDGTDIYVEHNIISNSGSGVPDEGFASSNGTSPRAGIDIEAYKVNAPDDNSVYDYERCDNIHIRNNTFINSYSADIVFFNGENAYAYGNRFSGTVTTSYGYNNHVYDNVFEHGGPPTEGSAIKLESKFWANGEHRIRGWEVYGNTIRGYQFGVIVGGEDHQVHDNDFFDNQRSIVLLPSRGNRIADNRVASTVEGSFGYHSFAYEGSYEDVVISGGTVDTAGLDLYLSNKNNDDPGSLLIDGVTFAGSISLRSVQDATIRSCTFESLSTTDCDPTLIGNNP